MRKLLLGVLIAAMGAEARGELPTIPPLPEPTSAATPAVVRPLAEPVSTTATVIHAPTTTVSPWTVSCQPTTACANPCEKRPGILGSLKNWICGSTPTPTCTETCTVTYSVPKVKAVAYPKPCPAPIVTSVKPAAECATCPKPTIARAGLSCEKLKAWLCWKPCKEQLLPVLCPTPYHAPARAFLGDCKEPTAPLPCGTCKKPAKAACETGTCPQPVGPVVAAAKDNPIVGWTPIYANYSPAASKVVPAGATVPVPPAAPAAKPQPVNPISRPFTSP